MTCTRRRTLGLGATACAGLVLGAGLPFPLTAQDAEAGDSYPTDGGSIVIHPVEHASLVMTTPRLVIYADPVGDPGRYAALPPADLILVTHEHSDHFAAETLGPLLGEGAQLLTNPAVHGMLPEALRARATAIANGERATVGDIAIDAIPAYNTTPDRLKYHPPGRDNGYLLAIDGRRVYVAGDTEDTAEMRALTDIDIAFVPMNLPYTMSVEQAAAAVAEFAPAVVYPYHYQGSDIDAFAALVTETGVGSEVIRGAWYPES
jgi:L-ascorbate metabolism protein UlaG (beta-lactamase superfamily)